MEIATDRLGFDRAARRLFLENGEEIRNDSQLVKNAVVYVSSGEEFRDPFLDTKRQIDQSKSIEWRSEGVRFVEKKSHHRNHRSSDDDEQSSSNGRNTPIINPYKSSAKTNNNGNRLMHNTKTTKRLIVFENGNEVKLKIKRINPYHIPNKSINIIVSSFNCLLGVYFTRITI